MPAPWSYVLFVPVCHLIDLSFWDYCDHRDLHSFPTRRSSDLFPVASVNPRHFAWVGNDLGRSKRRDRKSTRLNSSHRCISYAVFCLKKKKHHDLAEIVGIDRSRGIEDDDPVLDSKAAP